MKERPKPIIRTERPSGERSEIDQKQFSHEVGRHVESVAFAFKSLLDRNIITTSEAFYQLNREWLTKTKPGLKQIAKPSIEEPTVGLNASSGSLCQMRA